MSQCGCRCHVNKGAGCDAAHDKGGSGVAGKPYCGPHPAENTDACQKCGTTTDVHSWVEGDCILPHRRHSTHLVDGTHVCLSCVERWDETLTEITNLYADLAGVIPLGSVVEDEVGAHKHTKRDGSPAMMRLAAFALARNDVNPTVFDQDGQSRHTWLTDLPPIPDVLTNWAEAIWDARGWGNGWPTTVTGAAAAIRADSASIAAMSDVDTFDAELRWVHRALRAAHGLTDPQPLFDCISVDCAGHVWKQAAGAPRCDRCSRRYDKLDLVRARGNNLQERTRLVSSKTGTGHA